MNKSKIEWTDYTWNPIKGICPVGCWYCYARKMYNSKFYSKPPFDDPGIRFEEKEIYGDIFPKKPSRIFVCSTFELFHPIIPEEYRDVIFSRIEFNSKHTFQILTKLPENIDRPMPDNVWLGITLDGTESTAEFLMKESALYKTKAKLKFVSYEPLLNSPRLCSIDWVIAGKLTGYGKKYDPPKGWIELIVDTYSKRPRVPVFLKNNLKDIWGGDLIQEFPE